MSALPSVSVGLLDGVGRVESVVEVGNLQGLTVGVTVGCSCAVGCSCEDVTVSVAGHVSLEVLARCLSWPRWLALNTVNLCIA